MSHLSPDTFVDLLDGTTREDAVPHLATCDVCRRELESLRATWHAAADADVPEPSPLFWDHLSARVASAVAAEGTSKPAPWWRLGWSWNMAGLVGAAAAAVLVAVLVRPFNPAAPEMTTIAPSAVATVVGQADTLAPLADDESMALVADLASELDWDGVSEMGLAAEGGAARAVAELDDAERVELRRLLAEELGPDAGTL